MDIQVASNFERFLYYYFDQDSNRLCAFMAEFNETGNASIGGAPTDELFTAVAVGRGETLKSMAEAQANYDYILDPHTAVGYAATKAQGGGLSTPRICVATAHPAKFPDAVIEATGVTPTHPSLEALSGLPVRKGHIDANIDAVKDYLAARV